MALGKCSTLFFLYCLAKLILMRETRLGDVIELFTSATADGKTIVSGNIDGQNVFSALV